MTSKTNNDTNSPQEPRMDDTTATTTAITTPETPQKRRVLRPGVLIPAILVMLGLLVAAGLAFQPWRLVLDQTVDESIPTSAPAQGAPATGANPEPITLRSGSFIDHEHATQGTAEILELADGQRILRLEDFDTSNGPDLKVWLTDSRVLPGTEGWFVFDDGKHLDLGALKGNVGNQNYDIPPDVDLDDFRSVTIWCDRFNVSFGAAELSS